MSLTTINAETVVEVSADQARDWFWSLKDHPERYRFATHEGFEFVRGDFGDVGSRFRTKERFSFLKLELVFELIEVDYGQRSFRFKLINPSWVPVWGEFRVRELSPDSAALQLEIGPSNQSGQFWLSFKPVAAAIRQQITQEVVHIKASMESFI